MRSDAPDLGRRALLATALLAPLAGCATPAPVPTPALPSVRDDVTEELAELEREFAARLGVFAVDPATETVVAHRADERFAFCSMFKCLAAAAVLDRFGVPGLSTRVTYGPGELMASSFVTRDRVASGMTLGELCDAAVRHSDGTAGNLLLHQIGGPAGLTAYARRLGDPVTRFDRWEPNLAGALPGDLRDTTSPRAFGTLLRRVLVDDALPPAERALLTDLMVRNAAAPSRTRVRAGIPPGWRVADKTGTGGYGTANDVAVIWPPDKSPLVLALLTTREVDGTEPDDRLLARTAALVAGALGTM